MLLPSQIHPGIPGVFLYSFLLLLLISVIIHVLLPYIKQAYEKKNTQAITFRCMLFDNDPGELSTGCRNKNQPDQGLHALHALV